MWPLTPDHFAEYVTNWDISPEGKDPDYMNFEVTATYMHFPATACRIKQLLPDAKFIVLLRNPVDRAMSHYNMYLNLVEKGIKTENPRVEAEFNMEIDREIVNLRQAGCSFDGKGTENKTFDECYKC